MTEDSRKEAEEVWHIAAVGSDILGESSTAEELEQKVE